MPGGKVIEEHIGRVNSGDETVSIARMVAPPGWEEPAQTPAFTEYTVVLRGTVIVEHAGAPPRSPRARAWSPSPARRSATAPVPRAPNTSPSACPPSAPDTANRA